MTLYIDQAIAEAVRSAPLSLKDDPTRWPAGSAVNVQVVCDALAEAAHENLVSAVVRTLGRQAGEIAASIEMARDEDGALADLDAVLAGYVVGLKIDLRDVRREDPWQDQVDALLGAIGNAVKTLRPPSVPVDDLVAYIKLDPRLCGLPALIGANLSALRGAELNEADIPAFLKPAAPSADLWADEPDAADTPDEPDAADPWADTPEQPKPARAKRSKSKKSSSHPLCDALNVAGMRDVDVSEIMGRDRSYYSLVRNGRRAWPGLLPSQVAALTVELQARREGIEHALALLADHEQIKPEGAE